MFEQAKIIEKQEDELATLRRKVEGLTEQVDDNERNERGKSLVLWSRRFGPRSEGEDIQGKALDILRSGFPHIPLKAEDLSVTHRLAKDNSVICSFYSKDLRNKLYEGRLKLSSSSTPAEHRLFINESLTRAKRELFSELLAMKKEKRLWTVFTRNGLPFYKLQQLSSPVRVTSPEQIAELGRKLDPAAGRRAPPGPALSDPPAVAGADRRAAAGGVPVAAAAAGSVAAAGAAAVGGSSAGVMVTDERHGALVDPVGAVGSVETAAVRRSPAS
ncbi:hypothetical protein FJT64_009943 [Amphibalanus amphitrite]|uniref:Uncharacterized protein n=1 Tax=Amphibalanus amphitrite TaxID=1232801 RepID=A0A6A4VP22_AMPAM|nr:hypothetical protein FJT64_009943 [Amphibalanus amphitrite]